MSVVVGCDSSDWRSVSVKTTTRDVDSFFFFFETTLQIPKLRIPFMDGLHQEGLSTWSRNEFWNTNVCLVIIQHKYLLYLSST